MKLAPLQRFNKDMRQVLGSNAVTTEKGFAAFDQPGRRGDFKDRKYFDIDRALRPNSAIKFEYPTRDEVLSYLVQEQFHVCFPAGTLIRMADGTEKPIEQICLLDQVVTAECNVKSVVKTMVREYDGDMVRVKIWGNQNVVCTPEHPVLTERGYVRASDLVKGDWIAMPKYIPQDKNIINPYEYIPKSYRGTTVRNGQNKTYAPSWTDTKTEIITAALPEEINLDEKFGRIIGLYLAEGHACRGSVLWTFGSHETDTLVAELIQLLTDLGLTPHLKIRGSSHCVVVSIYGAGWSYLFDALCDKGAEGKRLHSDLCRAPKEFLEAVLKGWLDGDGHESENRVTGTTISRYLAMNMYDIAQALGLQPTLEFRQPTENKYAVVRQPVWHVRISTKQETRGRRSRQTESHVWRKVRVVVHERLEQPIHVYNLEVQDDNSYTAEGVGVHNCSPFSRAIRRLASDCSNDAMADRQPFIITVREKNSVLRRKIKDYIELLVRRLKLGLTGAERYRRTLFTGECVGQPIFEYDGSRWHLTKVMYMPTWEMRRDPKDETWAQYKKRSGQMTAKKVADWDIPDWMAVARYDEDQNKVHGTPIGAYCLTDYRMFTMAVQDLAIATRHRAPMRFIHEVGNPSGISYDTKALDEYKNRIESMIMNVQTDYYILKEFEKITPVYGDAKGVAELRENVEFYVTMMKESAGLAVNPEEMSGRGLESIDADHARTVNTLRMADSMFLFSIIDKGLIVEGYDDEVDYSITIPPLGETPGNAFDRAGQALDAGRIGYKRYAAITGSKDVEEELEDLVEWQKFKKLHDIQEVKTNAKEPKEGSKGTESPARGKDPQKGRTRRAEQRRAGKTPTGA